MGKEYDLTWVTGNIAVGGAPVSYRAMEELRNEGIDCILNLCAEYCDLHWIEADQGFEVYYLPIIDEKAPDLSELEKGLDWLDECIYLGKKVLIHCRFGIGRTGTVLNSYLLRRGLGHKMASKRLKKLRSKPQNFSQWRFVRKYAKQEGELTIREPSLETRNLVDLYPFFTDYERLVEKVDSRLKSGAEFCGLDHDRCCKNLVVMRLGEAVYLNHAFVMSMSRTDRLAIVDKAVEANKTLRQIGYKQGRPETVTGELHEKYRAADQLCPLNEMGECLVFDQRPLPCRLFDLPDEQREELRAELDRDMRQLSKSLFFAFTADFAEDRDLYFTLPEVVSGKFVQTFFYILAGMNGLENNSNTSE